MITFQPASHGWKIRHDVIPVYRGEGGLSRMFSRTCLANVSRHKEGEIVNVEIWRRNSCHSVAGMNAHLTNGFLMFALVIVATMRDDATVLGYSGAPLVMDQDIPLRTCRYSRIHSMIQVRCANLGLERIPSNLKTEIQVREFIIFFFLKNRFSIVF